MKFKYRKSNRLSGYDYATDGFYFITICTKERVHEFGEVIGDEMCKNINGEILEECWLDLPNHYENCQLDEHVVMPNHFHGIIIIENTNVGNGFKPFQIQDSFQIRNPFQDQDAFQNKRIHGLSEMVRGFKTFSSRKINAHLSRYGAWTGLKPVPTSRFQWQKSFHDHIIRDDMDLARVREYIIHNPAQWEDDENNIK